MRSNLSSAVAGNEGCSTWRSGLRSPGARVACPQEELIEVTLETTLRSTATRRSPGAAPAHLHGGASGKSLVGSAASGEGLVNVFRGTGKRAHGSDGVRELAATSSALERLLPCGELPSAPCCAGHAGSSSAGWFERPRVRRSGGFASKGATLQSIPTTGDAVRTACIRQLRAAACVLAAFALATALHPAHAFAKPAAGLSSKIPLGEVVQTERGPMFSLYDTSLLNTGSGVSRYAALPKRFDLRDVGGASFVTGVKNQGPYGVCWAFGALSSLESGLIVSGHAGSTDLSERHLVWYTYDGVDDSEDASLWAGGDTFVSDDPYNIGGNRWKSGPTLMRWYGAVDEASAPFSGEQQMDALDPDLRTESFLHVQNVVYLPESNEYVRKGTARWRIVTMPAPSMPSKPSSWTTVC
ncbi:MAG: C1 family peptidase [Eggerthellaceae bacterium]